MDSIAIVLGVIIVVIAAIYGLGWLAEMVIEAFMGDE